MAADGGFGGGVARGGGDTTRGKSSGEGSGATRGEAQKQEVALEMAQSGGGSAALPADRGNREAGWRKKKED